MQLWVSANGEVIKNVTYSKDFHAKGIAKSQFLGSKQSGEHNFVVATVNWHKTSYLSAHVPCSRKNSMLLDW